MSKLLHTCCAALVFLLGSTGLQAQEKPDFIYLLNGDEVEAKVKSIDGKFVEYTSFAQPGSPLLRFTKSEVSRVKMADGTEIWYNLLPKEAGPEKEPEAAPEPAKKKKRKPPVSAQKLVRQR